MGGRYRDVSDAVDRIGVLEPERVSKLVKRIHEVVIAKSGLGKVVISSKPGVAALRIGRIRKVGPRRWISDRRLRHHDIGAAGPRKNDTCVGIARD